MRTTALVACNEGTMACNVSSEAAAQLEGLTGSIGLFELASTQLASEGEPGSSDYELALVSARETARPMLQKIRHLKAVTATRTAPLPLLESRGVTPREWLEAARSERDESVLMLPTDEVPAEEGLEVAQPE